MVTKSKFLEIVCPRCNHSQMVYGKSTTKVKCEKCNKLLAEPTGGKTKIRAQVRKIIRVLWN